MFFTVILLITAFIILTSLIFTFSTAKKPNQNILLCITLPYSALENNEVTKLVQGYQKSYTFTVIASFLFLLPLFLFSKYTSISMLYFIAWCSLTFYASHIIQKIYSHKLFSLKKQNNWHTGIDSAEYELDEDEYWLTGNYNNPNDKRVFVEKRLGYGTTVNMATLFGKLTTLFLAVIIVGTVALAFFLMPLDFGSVDFWVEGDTAYIDAPMYHDSFLLENVSKIEQIDTLPKMAKNRGGDSSFFYVGQFHAKDIGVCTAYVHRNSTPYIIVTLSDRIIILNGSTPQKTEEYYLQLKTKCFGS